MVKHRGKGEEELVPFSVEDTGGGRAQRLQHLLFEEVDRLFRLEVNDRRLQDVAIVALLMSPDLRNAKVMYALRGRATQQEKQVQEGLERVGPFLRSRVAEVLSIKRTPDLHFHRDRVAEAALRAADLLEAEARQAKRRAAAGEPAQPVESQAAQPGPGEMAAGQAARGEAAGAGQAPGGGDTSEGDAHA